MMHLNSQASQPSPPVAPGCCGENHHLFLAKLARDIIHLRCENGATLINKFLDLLLGAS